MPSNDVSGTYMTFGQSLHTPCLSFLICETAVVKSTTRDTAVNQAKVLPLGTYIVECWRGTEN